MGQTTIPLDQDLVHGIPRGALENTFHACRDWPRGAETGRATSDTSQLCRRKGTKENAR